tara:strand:+ start:4689 stop:6005 length:1317 start_codon:yes stop_codon:yes gene_type:complete
MLFAMPVEMPSLIAGEIDFYQVPVNTSDDAEAFVVHMRTFSHNQHEYQADRVRAVHMGGCNLSTLSDAHYRKLLDSLATFKNLQRLRVNNCNLSRARVVDLMKVVKSMSNFLNPNEDPPIVEGGTTTTIWSELAIGGNEIDDHTFAETYNAVNAPLRGVGILSMIKCGITDASVVPISNLFPCTKKLFLCNTSVRGATVATALRNMRQLNIMGMDATFVSGQGSASILDAMVTRSQCRTIEPLEVWLRGVMPGPDDTWNKLLDFSSSARNASNFAIKHDRQVPIGHRPRHVAQVYELLTLKLHISGLDPFVFPYERVVCTKAVLALAREAINELNMIAMADDKDVQDRIIMRRRKAYREAFADLFAEGYFYNKRYLAGVVQMNRTNRFTGETDMTYAVDHSLLGVPQPDTDYVLLVEAEQVAPFSYNSDGALIAPRML